MMKIVAFCGETFFKGSDNTYVSKPTSASFLQDTIGEENVFVCSPFKDETLISGVSTKVSETHFYKAPLYYSTKDFFIKSLLKPRYYSQFLKFCDNVIESHKGDIFWIRTPSIGSIFFGLRALEKGQKVLHHMCADATNTWKNPKYNFFEKISGYFISRILRYFLSKICKHPNTINVCTGSVLEEFSSKYSPDRTYQFVDLMVKPRQIHQVSGNTYDGKCLKLLFVGRVVADKGIFDLLQAIKECNRSCHLTIVGNGPDYDEARKFVELNNLGNQVVFKGQVPHSELDPMFNNTDLTVIPSDNYYEGFPRVIMESWAKHKPVIVTQVGGIDAFVRDDINGFVVSKGNVAELKASIEKAGLLPVYNRLQIGAKDASSLSNQQYWIDILIKVIQRHTVR